MHVRDKKIVHGEKRCLTGRRDFANWNQKRSAPEILQETGTIGYMAPMRTFLSEYKTSQLFYFVQKILLSNFLMAVSGNLSNSFTDSTFILI